MARIPDEVKQEILDKTDIVELIGSYLPLKRIGGNAFRGLCPFHSEKTPSFNVNPQRQFFHCFGCKESGDAISFVRKYENLDFSEALKKLAERVGVTVREEVLDAAEIAKYRLRGQVMEIQRETAEWYQKMLFRSKGADAARARDYLKGRGINREIAERWKIGFAPADGRIFEDWARSQKYSGKAMVASGLMALRDDRDPSRGLYTRFRDRVMFPIANDYGEVIAFSGRVVDAASSPAKYMNSPETIVFNKSKTFFGLDKSKKGILKEESAVICEGQLDMIMCFEAGIENIVAPLGTAVTPDHARLLRRFTEEVVLCFDADEAGFKAAVRTFGELSGAGVDVKAVAMPKGHDPDTLLKEEGVDAFRARVKDAVPFYEYQIDRMGQNLDFTTIRDRMKFANDLAETAAQISDKAQQDNVVNTVATKLRIPPEEFRNRIAGAERRKQRSTSRQGEGNKAKVFTSEDLIVANDLVILCKLGLTDLDFRKWLGRNGDRKSILDEIPDSGVFGKVWDGVFDVNSQSSVNAFLSNLPEEEEAYLRGVLGTRSAGNSTEEGKKSFKRLEIQSVNQRIQMSQSALAAPGITSENIIKLTTQIAAMRKELLDLKGELKDIATASDV